MMLQESDSELRQEAKVLGKYLVGVAPPDRAVNFYVRVIREQQIAVSERDARCLGFVVRNPWSVGLIDGGLRLTRGHSEVRRRLYILFSILEAQPELHQYFLSQDRPFWYVAVVGFRLFAAGLKAAGGLVFVKLAGL